jgi:DNA replication protein DnaC
MPHRDADTCPYCTGKVTDTEWLKRLGVPETMLEATFETFKEDQPEHAEWKATCEEWIHNARRSKWYLQDDPFLVFTGATGTGKTHLCCAMLARAHGGGYETMRGLEAKFADAKWDDLRSSLRTRLTRMNFLIVDEIVPSTSKPFCAFFNELVCHRHDNGRPTVLASNLNLHELEVLLEGRTIDRIDGSGCQWLEMRGASHRQNDVDEA